jgi:hypothetical protein
MERSFRGCGRLYQSAGSAECHDHWKIPCEAPLEEIQKCVQDLRSKKFLSATSYGDG